MNKLNYRIVIIFTGVLLLVSGCVTASNSSAKKDKGWIEMKPLDSNDSGVINPDDHK